MRGGSALRSTISSCNGWRRRDWNRPPEASPITLLRRLSLDLLGLPPSPDAVDRYLADTRPGAYERLVERLLASPHYGERWGRHWLDVARYADSDGFSDGPPPDLGCTATGWSAP